MRHYRLIACVVGILFLITGCVTCMVENLADRHAVWIEDMNKRIGKPDIYGREAYREWFNKGYFEIVEYHGEQAFKRKAPYWNWGVNGASKSCGSTLLVSTKTLTVLGWEYSPGSDPEKCVANYRNCIAQ